MNDFICGECLEEMKKLPDKSVNMIFTSPPYADQIKDYGKTDVKISPDRFDDWFLPRAREMYRILKDDGSFVLNINDKVDGPYQNIFVFKLVVMLVEKAGFHLVRDYIWYNPATPPNVFSRGNMGRTKKSHEYCFWFSKTDHWKFDMTPIRKPYSERMKEQFAAGPQGDRAANTRPSRHNFDLSHAWKDNGGADPGSVIEISNTSSNDTFHRLCKQFGASHPARFPSKLAEFFILAGTDEGDVVLDPFGGSGTTAITASRLNRNFEYIEINPDYCDMAKRWLDVETNYDQICHDNVQKFCDDVLPKCRWDLLPFSFLYDLYKKWMPGNVTYYIPATKNQFLNSLNDVLAGSSEWSCELHKLYSSELIDQPEPMIMSYDLKHWKNHDYNGTDPDQICMPEKQKKYHGIVRIRP